MPIDYAHRWVTVTGRLLYFTVSGTARRPSHRSPPGGSWLTTTRCKTSWADHHRKAAGGPHPPSPRQKLGEDGGNLTYIFAEAKVGYPMTKALFLPEHLQVLESSLPTKCTLSEAVNGGEVVGL